MSRIIRKTAFKFAVKFVSDFAHKIVGGFFSQLLFMKCQITNFKLPKLPSRNFRDARAMGNDNIYVVRGGHGHGIYNTWAEALNAGWYQKQAFGNCCKFLSTEREEAEAFLKHEAFPEGRAGTFAKDMRQQHIFVRVFALAVVTTAFGFAIVKIAYMVHDKLECSRSMLMSSTPPCIYSHKVIASVSEKQAHIYNLIGAEIIILIGFAYTYFASWL